MEINNQNEIVGQYEIGKTLGQGTFGKVKLGTHLLTNEKVAIKILDKKMIEEQGDTERVSREIQILKKVRHPNIIQLYEIIETDQKIYLIMEFACNGELFQHIVSQKRIAESEACKYLQQLISGTEYIHRLGIVHRDLKPENLLFDSEWNIKIVDFGLSNLYQRKGECQTACGSPCYAAPEMIAGKQYDGLMTDIWSCGIIFYAIICGYLPFDDQETQSLYRKILQGQFNVPNHVSKEAKALLQGVLQTNPNKRFTIENIRRCPYYIQNMQLPEPVGIIIGSDKIPVDESILEHLSPDPQQKNKIRLEIQQNYFNQSTTHYYLLLQKYSNGKSLSKLRRSITNSTNPSQTPIIVQPIINNKVYYGKKIQINTQRVKNSNIFSPDQQKQFYFYEGIRYLRYRGLIIMNKMLCKLLIQSPKMRKTFKIYKPDSKQKSRVYSFDNVAKQQNAEKQNIQKMFNITNTKNKQMTNISQMVKNYGTVYPNFLQTPQQTDKEENQRLNLKNKIRIYKAQSHHDANIQAINKHTGFININCISNKSSIEIINNLMNSVKKFKYNPKIVFYYFYNSIFKLGRYQIEFQKKNLVFVAEVKMLNLNANYIHFLLKKGEQSQFTKDTFSILQLLQ